jgi:hypothetical protein
VNKQKIAYQRVRTRSDWTVRNFVTGIQVFLEAFCRILELAVVEVLHDGVLHLLLHVQGLAHIKTIMKTIVFKSEKYLHPGEGRFTKETVLINASKLRPTVP